MFRFSIIVLFCLGVTGCNEDEVSTSNGTGASNYSVQTDNSTSNDRLQTCPDCEKTVSKRAITCPHCGAPLIKPIVKPNLTDPGVNTHPPHSEVPDTNGRGFATLDEFGKGVVAAIKSQDPAQLLDLSFFPTLDRWNSLVTQQSNM